MSMNNPNISVLFILLFQFNLTFVSLSAINANYVITSSELCPDPIIRSNSRNIINQITVSRAVVSPVYVFDDSGQKIESCYYEPKDQINGAIPEYSVTIRYIRLSINPWSGNNNLTCKRFLQIGQDEKNDSCTMEKSSGTWYKWGLGPPAASFIIRRFNGIDASFPKLSPNSYNYLQMYFSIFSNNSNIWRIQQYEIGKENCDHYIPVYPICTDYSYTLDPEKPSSADSYSGIEKPEGMKNIIWSRAICPAFQDTFSESPLNFEKKEQDNYKTIYDTSSSSKHNRCVFESDALDEKGHKDVIIIKGIYSSGSLDWDTFPAGLSRCPEFIQFSTRKISDSTQRKLCELPDTIVSNVKFNPSIWGTISEELGFSYATFPKEKRSGYYEWNMEFYVYFFHKTQFNCTLRIQKYEKACQHKDIREYCRSYGDCSTVAENDVWSTIILENIQHQYSDDEYEHKDNQDHQASDSGSFTVFKFVISVIILIIYLLMAIYCVIQTNLWMICYCVYMGIIEIQKQFRHWRNPIRSHTNNCQAVNTSNAVAEEIIILPPTTLFVVADTVSQIPTSNVVVEEIVFSFPPSAPFAIDDGVTPDTNVVIYQFEINAPDENPPAYETCRDYLPTYSEATF